MNKIETDLAENLPVKKDNKKVHLDKAGYFLIRIHDQKIEAGFCNNQHKMLYKWASDSAADLSKAIADKNLNITAEHALYLGRELQRAETALKNNQQYIQD